MLTRNELLNTVSTCILQFQGMIFHWMESVLALSCCLYLLGPPFRCNVHLYFTQDGMRPCTQGCMIATSLDRSCQFPQVYASMHVLVPIWCLFVCLLALNLHISTLMRSLCNISMFGAYCIGHPSLLVRGTCCMGQGHCADNPMASGLHTQCCWECFRNLWLGVWHCWHGGSLVVDHYCEHVFVQVKGGCRNHRLLLVLRRSQAVKLFISNMCTESNITCRQKYTN